MTHPPLPLLLLWLAWILQAGLSMWNVQRFAGRRLARLPRWRSVAYFPKVTVIVPFKGLDQDLSAGVRSLYAQDYPDYALVFVVDSADDPAQPVLAQEMARHPERRTELLVAGLSGPHQSQKIHNQLFALDHLRACGDDEVWAFCDSDAVPGPQWLRTLVAPLAQPDKTGMTTGYRWLVPDHPAGSPALWSHLASVINSSVACLAGHDRTTQAWGGSMALRVGTARAGGLRERLAGALTDDYQFTRMCRDLGRRVYFAHLVPTPVQFDRRSLWNFAHRQYLITRIYAPHIYAAALAIISLYMAGLASAWVYLAWTLARAPADWRRWAWPVGALALVALANQGRAFFRRRAVRRGLGDAVAAQLAPTLRWDRWATSLWMSLHWLVLLRAGVGRTMTWRGLRYRLYGPQQCERVERGA